MMDKTEEGSDAMILEGQGSSFRMTVLRYQFPEIETDEWDSNWLVVEGWVNLQGKEWRFCDPCVTTFEAMQLAEWLDHVSKGAAVAEYCDFTEPNLRLDRSSMHTIRISFALESAPPGAQREDEWGFDVLIGPALEVAAAQLRRQLVRFPVRGGRSETGDAIN